MTIQEMFNRAWRGLQSQGFRRCVGTNGRPAYSNASGMHCPWGWVDPAQREVYAMAEELRTRGEGLAATLDDSRLAFATAMQLAHDYSEQPQVLEAAMRELAANYDLTIPA